MSTPMPADADAVRPPSQRHTITLKDGRAVPVEFELEAFWVIEDQFGSLEGFRAALEDAVKAENSEAGFPNAPVIQPIMRCMACVMPTPDLQDPRTLMRAIGLDGFADAARTLMAAFGASIGPAPAGQQDGHPNPQERATRRRRAGSPGGGSTTSRQSSSAAAKPNSGG